MEDMAVSSSQGCIVGSLTVLGFVGGLGLLAPKSAFAQEPELTNSEPLLGAEDLNALAPPRKEDEALLRFRYEKATLMNTLLAYGALNTSGGAALALGSKESFGQQVGIQMVAWGAIDAAIAGWALYSESKNNTPGMNSVNVAAERKDLSRLFWINAGLDAVYITAGALLWGLGQSDAVRGTRGWNSGPRRGVVGL
jgi:hypothetical protein